MTKLTKLGAQLFVECVVTCVILVLSALGVLVAHVTCQAILLDVRQRCFSLLYLMAQ